MSDNDKLLGIDTPDPSCKECHGHGVKTIFYHDEYQRQSDPPDEVLCDCVIDARRAAVGLVPLSDCKKPWRYCEWCYTYHRMMGVVVKLGRFVLCECEGGEVRNRRPVSDKKLIDIDGNELPF